MRGPVLRALLRFRILLVLSRVSGTLLPHKGDLTMLKHFARLLCVGAWAATAILAQSTGTIQGVVTDSSGAAVPRAAITVRNQATGEERMFTTDEAGLYAVPSLPVGRYSVAVKAAGLQTTTVNNLVLEVSRTVEQDFHLQVAAATESVEIVATTPVLETTT